MSTRVCRRRRLLLGSFGLLLGTVNVVHGTWSKDLTLEVFTRARAFQPGEAILLTIVPSRPLATLEGTAFDHSVIVWEDTASRWHGLAGIPLETIAGASAITLQAKSLDGETTSSDVPLTVTTATFETRHLKVAERFVDPPKAMIPRITKESETLAAIFANAQPERIWRGVFRRPVPGRSTSSFGRLSVLNGVSRGRHQGADFRATTGTPVVAPNAGRIALVADHYFSGRTVVIDHGGGLLSLFAHFSRVAVKTGELVKAGDQLGDAGATGRVTGPHVHWAVRLRGLSVDPLSLMAALDALGEKPAKSFQ
jgi:murein DD-endopeptidase MepM/ murein hydrolase activator NlpD